MRKKDEENLVSKGEDRTGVTFSGIVWLLMGIALTISAIYAALHFKD